MGTCLVVCGFYLFIKIYLDVLKCWTMINLDVLKCWTVINGEFILRITHTSFLAYRVCYLQPGAPIHGVGVRLAGV